MSLMYGLLELLYNGVSLGWIEKGSLDLGGKKGEVSEIYAEQVIDAPVGVLSQSNATINPTFNLIQLNYDNFKKVLGGTLVTSGTGDDIKTIGWKAPTDLERIEGEWLMKARSGQELHIPNALLLADLGGKMVLTETAKIECELKVVKVDSQSSYGVYDEGTITDDDA